MGELALANTERVATNSGFLRPPVYAWVTTLEKEKKREKKEGRRKKKKIIIITVRTIGFTPFIIPKYNWIPIIIIISIRYRVISR